jgi:hypothetical protein
VALDNEQLQLLDGIRPLAFLRRWQPQETQQARAECVHAPDQGRKHPDGQLQRLRDEEGDALRILEGDGLRDEFTHHDE